MKSFLNNLLIIGTFSVITSVGFAADPVVAGDPNAVSKPDGAGGGTIATDGTAPACLCNLAPTALNDPTKAQQLTAAQIAAAKAAAETKAATTGGVDGTTAPAKGP